MIILPRQARDKHRESSKRHAFLCINYIYICYDVSELGEAGAGGAAGAARRLRYGHGRQQAGSILDIYTVLSFPFCFSLPLFISFISFFLSSSFLLSQEEKKNSNICLVLSCLVAKDVL